MTVNPVAGEYYNIGRICTCEVGDALNTLIMDEASRKHKNIFYYGKLSHRDTLKLEGGCDLMTAIYDPVTGNHIYAAPNKFYESLMLGKPVIMVKGTGMAEILEKEDIGVLIDYSEESFAKGVSTLIHRRKDWENMSRFMKNMYEKDFSWSEMEKRLLHLYDRITFENI